MLSSTPLVKNASPDRSHSSFMFRQIPAVEETTAGASSSTQSPASSSAPDITRYSQVQTQEDLVCFLCNKLLEKSEELDRKSVV